MGIIILGFKADYSDFQPLSGVTLSSGRVSYSHLVM